MGTRLNRLLEANHQFNWTTECENSFVAMKNLLSTTPILVFPNFKKHFTLDCDPSDTGLGAVQSQLDENQTFVVYMNFHVCIMYVSCINTYRYIHEALFQYMKNT